jgi:hypothetical protein
VQVDAVGDSVGCSPQVQGQQVNGNGGQHQEDHRPQPPILVQFSSLRFVLLAVEVWFFGGMFLLILCGLLVVVLSQPFNCAAFFMLVSSGQARCVAGHT